MKNQKSELHMVLRKLFWVLIFIATLISCDYQEKYTKTINSDEMMIRISEIEIDPEYLEEYMSILKEESKASVELESGVISIYPMCQKENPNKIRILEIYATKEAYQVHLETPHFKHYKTNTSHMVKSLKLVDMNAIDRQTMSMIFKKIN